MRKLVYDVAITLDHFVAHEDGALDGFLSEGEHVTDYLQRLQGYDTVVMGRGTYEYGYRGGMRPGARVYPHMRHYIFSTTLQLGPDAEVEVVNRDAKSVLQALKQQAGTDIYLCGAGGLAGFLLDQELIDRLIVKLNPVIFGRGIRAFGDSRKTADLGLVSAKTYTNGVVLLAYDVRYPSRAAAVAVP